MRRADLDRFLAKVNRDGARVPGMALPCWEWTGATDAKGRPRFHLGDRGELARRALMEIMAGGELPADSAVAAICRNKLCVRPEHLVTCNEADARALGPRGRIGPGEAMLMRKHHQDGYEASELAAYLGVSVPLIKAIIREGASGIPANEPQA